MSRLLPLLLLLFALPASAAQHFLLAVSGIGGLDEYQRQFDRNALKLYHAAAAAGFDPSRIYLLSPQPIDDAPTPHRRSDLATIEQALSEIRARAMPGDRLFVVLLGHGNPREDSALFNLPGPDLSAEGLDALLQEFNEQTLVIVNTASASGPFIQALTRNGRIVITATSSGREYHAVQFGDHFVAALAEPGADRDKDERVSMLEAFDYARREVRRAYESEKRLLTEHALLDDNGDGVGSLDPGEFDDDGRLAQRVYLQPPPEISGSGSARMRDMLQQKQALEQSISELKQQREAMVKVDYYNQLEIMLIDLALLAREIRAQGG